METIEFFENILNQQNTRRFCSRCGNYQSHSILYCHLCGNKFDIIPKTLKDVMIQMSILHNGSRQTAHYQAAIYKRELEKSGFTEEQFSNYCVVKYNINL